MNDSEHDTDEENQHNERKNADASKNEDQQSSNYNNAFSLPLDGNSGGKASSSKSEQSQKGDSSLSAAYNQAPPDHQVSTMGKSKNLRSHDDLHENDDESSSGSDLKVANPAPSRSRSPKSRSQENQGASEANDCDESSRIFLESYMIFDKSISKDKITEDKIRKAWTETFENVFLHECYQLPYFTNIWLFKCWSNEKLFSQMLDSHITVDGNSGSIYFRATCFWFEPITMNATEGVLKLAIEKKIPETNKLKMIAQINSSCKKAIVIIVSPTEIKLGEEKLYYAGQTFNRIKNPKRIDSEPDGPKTVGKQNPPSKVLVPEKPKQSDTDKKTPKPKPADEFDKNVISSKTWYSKYSSKFPKELSEFIHSEFKSIFDMIWDPKEFITEFQRWSITEDRRSHDAHFEERANDQRHFARLTVMLNTYGIVDKEFYEIEDKKIKLRNDKLKTIVYNHQSLLQRGTVKKLSELKGFDETTVEVLDEDCVVAYKRASDKGFNPLLLNMANAYTPGGGYRRGDGAQEESIFRRSNYYLSLDADLDRSKSRLRYMCDESGKETLLPYNKKFYPIDHFGAIYTSGLTFFRNTESEGYALLEEPLTDVSAVAVSAYRDPPLVNNRLQEQHEVGTRKKIETIFNVAMKHGHDCLILSALGCGAFKNPPDQVAEIFETVIQKYAGFFKKIVFAIIDDHNTGKGFNPHGNFAPFENRFRKKVYRSVPITAENPHFGPHFVLRTETENSYKLTDVTIQPLVMCRYGATCYMSNEDHESKYLHPTECPYVNGKKRCPLENNKEHMAWYRHPKQAAHTPGIDRAMSRPDGEVCPWSPFLCKYHTEVVEAKDERAASNRAQAHCREFLHFCRFGLECNSKNDSHKRTTIHVSRPACRYGGNCTMKNDEEHIDSLHHPGIPDIRHVCRYKFSQCSQREKAEHISKFRHQNDDISVYPIPIQQINSDVSVVQNQRRMETLLDDYIAKKQIQAADSISEEVKKLIRNFQLIHRCSKVVFRAFLTLGLIVSDKILKKMAETTRISDIVKKYKLLKRIGIRQPTENVFDFIDELVQQKVRNPRKPSSSSVDNDVDRLKKQLRRDNFEHDEINEIQNFSMNLATIIKELQEVFKQKNEQIDDSIVRAKFGTSIDCRTDHVIIVFKNELAHHPLANFSIRPECSFLDRSILKDRPWGSETITKSAFDESKLHCMTMDYDEVVAKDLLLTIYKETKYWERSPTRISDYLMKMKYTQSCEAHLPDLIPLDYIEIIYISEDSLKDFSPLMPNVLKQRTQAVKRGTSKEIHSYYVNQLLKENWDKQRSRNDRVMGMFVNIEESDFRNLLTIPMHIDQLRSYYKKKDSKVVSSNDIFIYWESMNGDMMITFTEEKDDPYETKSLICYVAAPPKEFSEEYRENRSYITYGYPSDHQRFLKDRGLSSDDRFHQCTNTENFLHYCLKIDTAAQKVVLSHVGPNRFFNNKKIEAEFKDHRLKLENLRFIHLSAGESPIPIRNFIVRFSPLQKLHNNIERADSSNERESKDFGGRDAHPQPRDPGAKKDGASMSRPSSGKNSGGAADRKDSFHGSYSSSGASSHHQSIYPDLSRNDNKNGSGAGYSNFYGGYGLYNDKRN